MTGAYHKKSFNFETKDFDRIYNGTDIIEVQIGTKKKERKCINALINGDIVLRIEKKQRNRSESFFINESFIKNIISNDELVKPSFRNVLKKIFELDKQIKDKVNQTIKQGRKGDKYSFDGFYLTLEKRWKDIEKLQKKIGVQLLRKDKVGYCDSCCGLRNAEGIPIKSSTIAAVNCEECNNPISQKKTIMCLPDPISDYINGIWFEDFIAEKLRKLGWRVWSHIYVYGGSGVKHEIDVFAIKDGLSLLVECKTGFREDEKALPIFISKFFDIKTNLALFVSTQKIQNQFKGMIQKNPSFKLIDDIKNDRGLIIKLKEIK